MIIFFVPLTEYGMELGIRNRIVIGSLISDKNEIFL